MTLQYSTAIRNARLDAIPATAGASAKLKLRTGAPPANCAAADSGTELVPMNLPATYIAAASGGVSLKAGSWSGAGIAAGDIGHFRLYANDGVTCHIQGTVTLAGGGGDMIADNVNVAIGQIVTVSTFSQTDPNG